MLPADAVRPVWSSAGALVYGGGIVMLFATIGLLGVAEDDGGEWAFTGAALFACAAAFALAVVLQRGARAIAAGVAATLGVVFAGIATGAFLSAVGALEADVGDYQPATLVVWAVVIGSALAALARFRAPLPVLPAAVAFWLALTDLGSLGSWGDAGEVLSVVAGLLLVADGIYVDRAGRRPYGFWLHAVGGLAAGGGLVVLVGDDAWALTALIGLAFVAVAFVLGRSSYAVLGTLGVLIATTLFAVEPSSFVVGFVPYPAVPADGSSLEGWQVALAYLVTGLLLAGIGVLGRVRWPRRAGPDPARV